jgi:hypothetical protein
MYLHLFRRGALAVFFVLSTAMTIRAGSGNALDRLDFGNLNSEQSHHFNPNTEDNDQPPLGQSGACHLPYRQAEGTGPGEADSRTKFLFTMTCDPDKQNYLSIKVWGSDTQQGEMYLIKGPDFYPPIDANGSPEAFPNRFYYYTVPIPLDRTTGKTSVDLGLDFIESTDHYGGTGTHLLKKGELARPLYSVFTHVEPRFIPDSSDPTGEPLPQVGKADLQPLSHDQASSLIRAMREKVFAKGNYFDQVLAKQIMPGTPGAPPEVIGLDIRMPVDQWIKEHPHASITDWRNYVGTHWQGPGYAMFPDELVSVLITGYLLPPMVDKDGLNVDGLDHFHDATLIDRIVSAFDGASYLQVGDGGFGQNTGGFNEWQGLCSTPREGGNWPGTTKRGPGWTLTLEGPDSEVLGSTILRLLNDPTGAPLFKKYLDQSYDADLTGTPMKRAYAYERMLFNHYAYLRKCLGGTVAQNLMGVTGAYAQQVALEKLQQLYPNTDYPALPFSDGLEVVEQALGLAPDTLLRGKSDKNGFTSYALSAQGLGEAAGTFSGSYDGRYGQIIPWLAPRVAQLAAMDPGASSADDKARIQKIAQMARNTIAAYDQFISPGEMIKGSQDHPIDQFTLAQEDFITYRNTYNPNANGDTFEVNSQYPASDPAGIVKSPYALRSAYLQTLYPTLPNATPDLQCGGHAHLQYGKDLPAYEATLHALVDVDPGKLTPLPGEPGQPDFAWADLQSGSVAFIHQGERFYATLNWRRPEAGVNNYARIHDTTSLIDRAALVDMPHDAATAQSDGNLSGDYGQPWVLRYGNYLIILNRTDDAFDASLPPGQTSALDLISHRPVANSFKVAPQTAAIIAL